MEQEQREGAGRRLPRGPAGPDLPSSSSLSPGQGRTGRSPPGQQEGTSCFVPTCLRSWPGYCQSIAAIGKPKRVPSWVKNGAGRRPCGPRPAARPSRGSGSGAGRAGLGCFTPRSGRSPAPSAGCVPPPQPAPPWTVSGSAELGRWQDRFQSEAEIRIHLIRWDKCLGGKRENRLVLRRPRLQPAGFTRPGGSLASQVPGPLTGPHCSFFPSSGRHSSQTPTAPPHGCPQTPPPPPCPVPDTDRRLTLPEDLTVLQEKRCLNLFHGSLLKTSLELTVPKARNPDRGPYKRGAAHPP